MMAKLMLMDRPASGIKAVMARKEEWHRVTIPQTNWHSEEKSNSEGACRVPCSVPWLGKLENEEVALDTSI